MSAIGGKADVDRIWFFADCRLSLKHPLFEQLTSRRGVFPSKSDAAIDCATD
jgi:hypothetical protein